MINIKNLASARQQTIKENPTNKCNFLFFIVLLKQFFSLFLFVLASEKLSIIIMVVLVILASYCKGIWDSLCTLVLSIHWKNKIMYLININTFFKCIQIQF